jgi:hypothetical protein
MDNKRQSNEEGRTKVFTALVDKHYSPLVIRKYTHWGFPIYVGLITDNDLTDLDQVFKDFMDTHAKEGWVNNIQILRDMAGEMTEYLNTVYEKTEGVAVVFYVDKCFISSLHGDFMNHASCRIEFYGLLQMSTGV